MYKKGTAHLEIDNVFAEQLNAILANLYPNIIVHKTKERQRPRSTRKIKEHGIDSLQLGHSTLKEIQSATINQYGKVWELSRLRNGGFNKNVFDIFKLFGGKRYSAFTIQFDYDPTILVEYIKSDGVVPDYKTHQFYPTPKHIVQVAQSMLGGTIGKTVLEPSAGLGYLVDGLESGNVTCIDIAPAFCEVLKSKGYNTMQGDFMKYAESHKFDAVIMNPPFDNNQAIAHVQKAYNHLKYGGVLVAIMPESYKDKIVVTGVKHEYSDILTGFDNTLSSNPTIKLVADVLAYPYKQVSYQFTNHKRKINL